MRALGGHVGLIGGMILVTLNLRTDVWVASGYGVSVAEAHSLLPTWIVPLLSLALVFWTALVLVLTKPKSRS